MLNKLCKEKVFLYSKYLFSFLLVLLSYKTVHSKRSVIMGIIELLIVFYLSNIIGKKNKVLMNVFNDFFMLLINIQYIIIYFSASYLQLIMLNNFESLEALSGKMYIYIIGVLLIIVFSFFPVFYVYESKKMNYFSLFILLEIILCFSLQFREKSPIYNYIKITKEFLKNQQIQNDVKNTKVSKNEFEKTEIKNYIKKPANLNNPNIVLVFVEGLSKNIIDDPRNIMPSISGFSKRTISFENYYNHTAATYRGLIGQLTSGYQLNNQDSSSLTSLQSVLSRKGYDTTFINTEPRNELFTKYLEDFRFDNLITDESNLRGGHIEEGEGSSMADKEAYNLLYNTIVEKSKGNNPFFVSMYSFGTHVSFDSLDQKFGDGKDRELNKFYNLDCQFKTFLDKFLSNKKVSDNTILVLTSDHCTYADQDYVGAFGNRDFPFTDKIPLYIYYKDVISQKIDVNGRNSLGLAPTLLDLMDISEKNYFIGTSLFGNEPNKFEYYTIYLDVKNTTKDNIIKTIPSNDASKIDEFLTKYFSIK